MSLSPERLKELKEMGLEINQRPLISKVVDKAFKKEEQKIQPKEPTQPVTPQVNIDLSAVFKLLKVESQNLEEIVKLNKIMASVICTLTAVKPKKNFICRVARDSKGNINQVNIEEK